MMTAEQVPLHRRAYLSRAEAAEYMRCSLGMVKKLLQFGKLRRRHVGRRVLIARTDIDRYLRAGK